MSQTQIQKALVALIKFKKDRLNRGFWNEKLPGHDAIDKTLKAFNVEVSL